MSVQVWVGEIPEHAQEREAIVALARGLARLEELYLILANFTVGGQAVDMAIFKRDGGFVIELKHCDGRIIGGVNGRWRAIDANNEVHVINPDRRNPYNQVISYFYRLSNFLNQNRHSLLSEHRAAAIDFRTCRRLVVISPFIHPESEIELDWKVDLKGLDELPTYLVTATSSEIDLTDEELLAIPELLRCEPWHDVNLLVGEEGVELLPLPEEISPLVEGLSETAVEAVLAEEISPPSPWPRWVRPLAVFLAAFVLLGAAGFWSGAWTALWDSFHPSPTPTVTPTVTRIMIDTPIPPPDNTPVVNCEWVEQAVIRDSAYANGEVEVVLRTVCFQEAEITLQWVLINHGIRPVRFPLNQNNITIRDNVGNEYQIDEDLSAPRVLVARSAQRIEGTCTVPRPVSPDAITMIVTVNGEPFEGREAVWPLNIPGRE